ncbi:hypothetical protein [Pararhizobium sp. PWRC1-1]|uniref:hypothetical protein n=1 Tax=Pararhizobium sp. PWRC1-1 TaxID=2804566 RepID=UPI003CE7F8E3
MPILNRRSFGALAASSFALAASDSAVAQSKAKLPLQGEKYHVARPSDGPRPKVAMLLFPGLTPLDLIGPQTALNAHCDVHLVWKNTDVMMSDSGVVMRADTLVEECPRSLVPIP